MIRYWALFILFCASILQAEPVPLQKGAKDKDPFVKVTASAQASLVTITQVGRKNEQEALGSGFVITEDGWIATNQHVIGQSRQLRVKLHDGSTCEVSRIIATDPKFDLAIIQIPKKGLRPLPLGEEDELNQGQQIVALGNPHGVGHSVVQGVISAFRDIDGISMIQIAMPIEEGNSGGPVLDLNGKVQGIITLKSAITQNLGFAHLVSDLKKLISHPNPIPMKNWLTIGRLDGELWASSDEHIWSQSAGMIQTNASNQAMGGRSLCLNKNSSSKDVEFSVQVKLGDERGAAGLAFFSDGKDRHYGFYPSAGEMRLVRFDGADVYSWHILKNESTPAYRHGQWNSLKVQVKEDRLICYVNDQQVFDVSDATYREGKAGLCKFRKTDASFKKFQSNSSFSNILIPVAKMQAIENQLNNYFRNQVSEDDLIKSLSNEDFDTDRILGDEQFALEAKISKLKMLQTRLHEAKALRSFIDIIKRPEIEGTPPKLLEASLHLANYDNPDVEVDHYLRKVEKMAMELKESLPANASQKQKLERLNQYLFTEQGFHGSRSEDIDNFSNSYINEVLEDREGIPVSLSILFLDLAHRIQLQDIYGVSLPGRFMVACKDSQKDSGEESITYIDVYDQGKTYSHRSLEAFIFQLTGQVLSPQHLAPSTDEEILLRVLNNFIAFSETPEQILRYLDLILAINPDAPQERMQRALICLKLGQTAKAKEDIGFLLESNPTMLDLDRLRQLYRSL